MSTLATPAQQARALLDALFDAGDLVEFRCFGGGPRRWDTAATWSAAIDDILRAGPVDAYFGANPRRHRGGGGNADAALGRALVVDWDHSPRDRSQPCTISLAREWIAQQCLPTPTALVASGRGVHAWWRLDEPMLDLDLWRRSQRAMARLLISDPAICDPARIMRLPGTRNTRYPDARCELVECVAERRYSLAEFPAPEPTRKLERPTGAVTLEPGSMSELSRRFLAEGRCLPQGRRATAFTVACDLHARGWAEDHACASITRACIACGLDDVQLADLPRQVHNAFAAPRTAILDAISEQEERVELLARSGSTTPTPICSTGDPSPPSQDARGAARLITFGTAVERWLANDAPSGLPTLPFLQRLMPHGLPRGQMVCLLAQPGVGKTALALQIATRALVEQDDLHCVWAMGEMTASRLVERIVACEGAPRGLTLAQASDRTPPACELARDLVQSIGHRLHILPDPLVTGEIVDAVTATDAGIVVVDYLQLCRPSRRAMVDDRRAEVDGSLRELRSLTTQRECAMVLISNLAKGISGKSQAADLCKESSEIAYQVDVMLHISTEGEAGEAAGELRTVRIHCAKNRHGPCVDSRVHFDAAGQRFAPEVE